ncbi:DUF5675 family protein [Cognataquiflexum aquatile]|uniref:DUF5675 family protein n=1 Tax=Cognataquiflexum aquatile TaxID=2249427 RepID=UPI000DE98AEB|nr:DUF5675 family protein [Cognataquiflexum aquatile]
MLLHLEREYWPGGTNGTIRIDGFKICHTVESAWRRNNPDSCFPEGAYPLEREYSEEHGWHLVIREVSGRGLVRILPQAPKVGAATTITPVSKTLGEGRGSQSRYAFEKFKELVYSIMDQKEVVILEIRSFPDAALNLVQFELSWMD